MFEEGGGNMDKKSSRQSSVPPKNGATSDTKKNDNNSPNRFTKHGKKREGGGSRGPTPDYGRRPAPQKSRVAGDKRPRSRGNFNDRQREEVAESLDPEYGSPLYAGSKKASLNHLLNFTFADRETGRSTSGAGGGGYRGGRRRSGRLRYNKERFLQANCQFIVADNGDYTVTTLDADTLVNWDHVEQVRTMSHESPSCPICLQHPQAGKITRCGHIYCWACILHYLALGEKSWVKCPICYDYIHKEELRSVQTRVVHMYKPGETITLRLMKRQRGSTFSVPRNQWEMREGKLYNIEDEMNTEFMKLLVASPSQIQKLILEPERLALEQHMLCAEESEVCFIEAAMASLKEREIILKRTLPETVADEGAITDNGPDQHSVNTSPVEKHMPSKRYASAFDDQEESEDEDVKSDSASELSLTLPESPIPAGDLDASIISSPPFVDLPQPNPHTSPQEPLAGAEAHVVVPRERTTLSESSTGSQDEGYPESDLQTVPEGTLPVEEAAEHLELPSDPSPAADGKKENKAKDMFYYFQACDGQHIYLHALNARCLVKEYGSLENCPNHITAVIIDTESIFMTEELRRRLRYLSHLPLTCEFQVAELILKPPLLSRNTLKVFSDDIERRRRWRQKKLREDKKRSKKIEEEENKKMGLYPPMRISLSNMAQFPSTDNAPGYAIPASPDVASISSSVSSVASSPPVSPSEYMSAVNADNHSDGEQTSLSFAQMLKAGKSKPKPVWPKPADPVPVVGAAARPTAPRSADSEDSDNEDRVPVPMFQDSFSCAIQAALDTIKKPADARPATGGKKKKQKQKLLFTTSMTRGK